MAEVADFHVGSHTNTYQTTHASPWNLFSLPEQSQRGRGHLSLKLSLSIQSGFFGLFWRLTYINRTGQLPNTWSLPFGYPQIFELQDLFIYLLVLSYYWENIGLEYLLDVQLPQPEFPHL